MGMMVDIRVVLLQKQKSGGDGHPGILEGVNFHCVFKLALRVKIIFSYIPHTHN